VSGALAALKDALPNTPGVNSAYMSLIAEIARLITQTSKFCEKSFEFESNFRFFCSYDFQ
jgi:hypothetical protein